MPSDLITIRRETLHKVHRILKEIVDQDRLPSTAMVYKATVCRSDTDHAITLVRNLLGLEPLKNRRS